MRNSPGWPGPFFLFAKGSGSQHPPDVVFQPHPGLAQFRLMFRRQHIHPSLGPVNSAVDCVILVHQPREMGIRCLQRVDRIRLFGEILVKIMGRVRNGSSPSRRFTLTLGDPAAPGLVLGHVQRAARRNPAALASASVQNHRSPAPSLIRVAA